MPPKHRGNDHGSSQVWLEIMLRYLTFSTCLILLCERRPSLTRYLMVILPRSQVPQAALGRHSAICVLRSLHTPHLKPLRAEPNGS